jgi:hypothetical protein
MKIKSLICVLFAFAALMSACKKDNYTPTCDGTTKSFANDVMPLFQAKCNNCHSVYSDYAAIYSDQISIRPAIVDGSMPQNSSLSTDERNIIVCWIDNGAPFN